MMSGKEWSVDKNRAMMAEACEAFSAK